MQKNNLKIDLSKELMDKINSGELKMRPKIYFFIGSLFLVIGFAGTIVYSSFLFSLLIFASKRHGFFWQSRIINFATDFPFWIFIIGALGIFFGVYLLKKFDFSYKKNFWFVPFILVLSIFSAAFLIDKIGINERLIKKGPMKGFYYKYNGDLRYQNHNKKPGSVIVNPKWR